ncbi:DUF881 domain-containing protein [Georgenia sp. Z1344]|uniref:DUF881 domain-containing protein n=1 Tax=Georgenia sp. Z1344 TaxID=3416706 RepID=UPI003CF3C25C
MTGVRDDDPAGRAEDVAPDDAAVPEDDRIPDDGSDDAAVPEDDRLPEDGSDDDERPDSRARPWWQGRASDLLVVVLCALLGVALVAQVRHTQEDPLAALRQDDLVRLLDDLDRRNIDLVEEQDRLQEELDGLRSAADSSQAAADAAAELAGTQGVLAGTVPAAGPGVEITVTDPGDAMRGQTMVTMIQELRNAGAEAIEIGGVRLTATSYVIRSTGGLVVDGTTISSPYVLRAIGDPQTMQVALEIPGGALSTVRGRGATVSLIEQAHVEIRSVAEPRDLEHSRVVED